MENQKNILKVLEKIDKDSYDLFIFDFDGTLVEPLKVDWLGLKKELCRLGEIDFREGIRVSRLLEDIKRTHGKKGLKEAYDIVGRYEAKAIGEAKVRKEIEDFISEVLKQGKKVAIFSTNMRETIGVILKKFNLEDRFHLIVAKEDVKSYKPDPEGLQLILSKLKIPNSEALFFGDKEVDLVSGRKAKVKTILIS